MVQYETFVYVFVIFEPPGFFTGKKKKQII